MAQTKKFSDRIKSLLDKNFKKNEWDHFLVVSETLQSKVVNKQLYGLYKASIGRTYAPGVAQLVIDILTGMHISQIGGVKNIFSTLQSELELLLNEDKELSTIQKFFKEYKNDLEYILDLYNSLNNFAAPYLAVLALAGKEDADLVEALIQFAGILRTQRITKSASECLVYEQKQAFDKCEYAGLQYLRSLVNHYAIIATMKPLPEIAPKMTNGKVKELLSQCHIYGADKKLEEVLESEALYLAEILEEIEDIFLDFPQGKVRKEGLKMFKKYAL